MTWDCSVAGICTRVTITTGSTVACDSQFKCDCIARSLPPVTTARFSLQLEIKGKRGQHVMEVVLSDSTTSLIL